MTRLEKQVDISLLRTITTDQDRTCPVQFTDNDLIVLCHLQIGISSISMARAVCCVLLVREVESYYIVSQFQNVDELRMRRCPPVHEAVT